MSKGRASGRSGALVGASGLFLASCCLVAPVIFGVAIGTTIGGLLDAIAAILVAMGVALMLHRRRASKGQRC